MYASDKNLFRSLIRRAAAEHDNRSSVLADSSHECRYPEIPDRLEAIQSFLRSSGVERGDCVTVELNNSVRAAITVLALLDAGFSFAPIPVAGQGARAGGGAMQPARFTRWILTVDTQKPTAALAGSQPSDFLRLSRNDAFHEGAVFPAEDDPHLFFRTSGSLGTAKVVAHRYSRFHRNTLNTTDVRQFDASCRLALPTPIFHSFGLSTGLLAGLAGGVSIDLQERSNVLRFFEREAEFRPSVAYATPSFCEMLVRSRRSHRPYRYIVTGGDRISAATFKRAEDLHGPLVSQYGLTEMGVVATARPEMPFDLRSQTVGRPLAGVEVRIVPLPAAPGDEQGELQIRHDCGFEGYVDLDGRPLLLPHAFDGDWYRTGDLAMAGPEGTLAVLGRCDLSVNRQGVLLPLAEVESRMRELTGVEEVAIAAGPEDIRGRSVVAFCVLARGVRSSGAALRADYAKKAPAFSVPEVVHIMDELPKLQNGKIDRQALAKLANDG